MRRTFITWRLAIVIFVNVVPLMAQSPPTPAPYVYPLFVDGGSGGLVYQSSVKILRTDPANPTRQCTLTQRQTDTAFVGIQGDHYTADVFDSGDSVPAITNIGLNQYLPWEVLRSSGHGALKTGYAVLSCSAPVQTDLQISLLDPKGTKLGETSLAPAMQGNSFEFLLDTRDGTRLGFSLANDSAVEGVYTVIARDEFNTVADVEFDILQPWSQVSRFVDDMLRLPKNFVGSIEVVGVTGGNNYAVGLRFTGPVFATVSPLVRNAPLHF